MAHYYSGGNNKGKLWNLASRDGEEEQHLPRIVLFPRLLADWLVEKKRHGHDLVEKVLQLIDDDWCTAVKAKELLNWGAGIAQKEPGKSESALGMKVDSTMEDENIYKKFCTRRLATTCSLPVEPEGELVWQQGQGQGGQSNLDDKLEKVADSLDNLAQGMA